MAEHPNAAVMRRAHEAFSSGDMATLQSELMSPDIVWHMPGRSALAGDYRGLAGFEQLIGKIMELSGGTFRVDRHDTVASDDHAINLDRVTADRGGKKLDIQLALVVHIKEGKIAEAWDMFSDTQAWDEFWS